MKIVIDMEESRYNWIMSHASNDPGDYADSEDLFFRKAVESGAVLPETVNMLPAFNINDWIKVKLTDKGKEILHNYWNRICLAVPQLKPDPSYFATHTDADGYTRFQLWEFMQIFGEHLRLGSPLYIENNEMFFEMSTAARTE